ncbi:MAG: AAA family ATPase [Chloroflexi bacterium]|nr:AAA family ATPase [Chloroflexota bacterium]
MPDERRLVTVLFADVVGSTALGDSLDPEDLRALLTRYYAIAREVIGGRDGTLEKFIGDAVMAIFGLPTAHDDDPARALDAALALREAVQADPLLVSQLPIRIGVNSGEVVASGDREASDFLVTGDPVNVAARLQQAARSWQILCGERTARASQGGFTFGERVEVKAPGKAVAVRAFELTGRASRHTAPRTPLIGRSTDLEQLDLVARRAFGERRPYLVSIIAPPGTGKTRLLQAFLERLPATDPEPLVAVAQCLPYGQRLTYWPLRALLTTIAGIDPDTPPEALRGTVARWLRDVGDADADRTAGQIAATLGSADLEVVDQQALFGAWQRLIELAAVRRPLVLVVEDLHWSSDTLLDLVESVFQPRADVPLLMLALSRPELLDRRRSWGGGRRNYLSISLEPLGDSDVSRLVASLLESPAVAVVDAVVARAGGNPFYAAELVRSLIEQGADLHDPDSIGQALARLPDTVQATILARLDLLAPLPRRLLQVGSVLGRSFDRAAVIALDADLEERFDAVVGLIIDRELLVPTADGHLAFHHILIREVAYGTLPRLERGVLHAAAGRHLERIAGQTDELAELVAFHFREAATLAGTSGDPATGLRAAAVRWLRRAAAVAQGGGATLEATNHLRAAIDLATPAELPELYLQLGDDFRMGDESAAAYVDAYRHGKALGRPDTFLLEALANELMVLCRFHAGIARQPSEGELQAKRDEARRLSATVEDERVRAIFFIADAFMPFWIRSNGRREPTPQEIATSRASAESGVALAERLGIPQLLSGALDALSSFVVEESPRAAREIQRRRWALVDRLSSLERGDAFQMVAWQSALLGDVDEALRAAETGLATVGRNEAPETVMLLVAWEAWALALAGRWPEVDASIMRSREMWLASGRPSAMYILHGFLAAAVVAKARGDDSLLAQCRGVVDAICGRFPSDHPARDLAAIPRFDVEALAERVVSGYERYIERLHHVALAVWVCADSGYPLARRALDGIIAFCEPRGMHWIEAEARRARALAVGDTDELARAVALLRTTGAVPRLARAEADLGTLTGDLDLREAAIGRLEASGDVEAVARFRGLREP